MARSRVALLLIGLAGAATGQPGRTAGELAARARALTEATPSCPGRPAGSDAIVICARTRESRYRIPQVIREEPQPRKAGAATAWGTRTADADETARGGRAGSSSVDGAGGQSGLHQKVRREWELERQAIDARRDAPER